MDGSNSDSKANGLKDIVGKILTRIQLVLFLVVLIPLFLVVATVGVIALAVVYLMAITSLWISEAIANAEQLVEKFHKQ